MSKLPHLATLCLLAAATACSSATTDEQLDSATVAASAPMLGVPGGQDAADHACNVVLRSVARVPGNGGGYETNCVPGSSCWYIWDGTLELSDEAAEIGATPIVLFQSGSDQTWWKVTGKALPSTDGRNLFSFRLDEHTVPDGMSMTSLMRTKIQLAPAIEMPDDSRLFDHNRNPGDFDNYVLDSNNSWSIGDDVSVCSSTEQRSEIHFRSDWQNVQQGALVAGGSVTVDYDLSRLPQCMGSTYQGSPSWNTTAHARFLPSGDVISGPVSEYAYSESTGNQVVPVPWQIDIPNNASSVEFWFETGGMSCNTNWDSNFGSNFRFPVLSSPVNATIGWAGDGGATISRGMCESRMTNGLPGTIVLDSWALTRAECLWVNIDVYAPGITDQHEQHPEWLEARAVFSRDGAEPSTRWMSFVGRVGNNYRYRWDLRDGNDFVYTPWDLIEYSFQFSVDGNTWFDATQSGGEPFTVQRGEDWCPSTYWGDHC